MGDPSSKVEDKERVKEVWTKQVDQYTGMHVTCCVARLQIQPGTPCLPLLRFSYFPREHEVMLDRGSRFTHNGGQPRWIPVGMPDVSYQDKAFRYINFIETNDFTVTAPDSV